MFTSRSPCREIETKGSFISLGTTARKERAAFKSEHLHHECRFGVRITPIESFQSDHAR